MGSNAKESFWVRERVSVILSPPTVSLQKVDMDNHKEEDLPSSPRHQGLLMIKACSLCKCDDDCYSSLATAKTADGMRTTVRGMMAQVGLELDDAHLTFCPFCLIQLGNLMRLKKEMDRLGERLACMIIGLRTLFSEADTCDEVNKRDEDEVEIKPVVGIGIGSSTVENSSLIPSAADHDIIPTEAVMETDGRLIVRGNRIYHMEHDATSNHATGLSRKESSGCSIGFYEADTIVDNGLKYKTSCNSVNLEVTNLELLTNLTKGFNSNVMEPRLAPVKVGAPRETQFSCFVCNKSFKLLCQLKDHSILHTGARPFPCPRCPKAFRYRSNLRRHLSSHGDSTGKPFVCSICKKRLGSLETLKQHLLIHEKPYSCPVCSTTFAQKGNLERHMVKGHVPPGQ